MKHLRLPTKSFQSEGVCGKSREKKIHLSNGLFFIERFSLITATVCAYKSNNARYENLFAHAVAVIKLDFLKKNNPMLIFTFLKHFLKRIFYKF